MSRADRDWWHSSRVQPLPGKHEVGARRARDGRRALRVFDLKRERKRERKRKRKWKRKRKRKRERERERKRERKRESKSKSKRQWGGVE